MANQLELAPEVVPAPPVDRDQAVLEDVPFGRNRFLKWLGAGLFGIATGMILKQEPAAAQHIGPHYPCFGLQSCHYCSGYACTQYCWSVGYLGCPTGAQCWLSCNTGNNWVYRCCDYKEQFPGYAEHECVCGGIIDRRC